MIPEEVLRKTEQRFAEQANVRRPYEQKLKGRRSLLEIDRPERVVKRLERLGVAPEQRERVLRNIPPAANLRGVTITPPAEVPPSEVNALERVLGQSDLMSVTFLLRGFQVARAVARIRIRNAQRRVVGYGTGFMVSPRLLLTNNHVLATPAVAATSELEFGYQEELDGRLGSPEGFSFDPTSFFVTDQTLDYTLVGVQPENSNWVKVRSFGWSSLIEEEGKVLRGEYLNIIQHPNGETKQLALRENQLIDLLENFLHYRTDTAPGSSGSPVFNDQWEVVALHHSGVPERDAQGRILSISGEPWTRSMGEHRISWVMNEGVRISRILRDLKRQQSLSTIQRRLIDEMLDPSNMPEPLPEGRPQERSLPTQAPGGAAVQADGTVVWTIPLEIGIRIGGATSGAPVPEPAGKPAVPAADRRTGSGPAPVLTDPQIQDALAELEVARSRPYYDEPLDRRNSEEYYSRIDEDLAPEELFRALSGLVKETHREVLPYKPLAHLYPWVDLQEDGMVRSIYSGEVFDPGELILEDFQIDQEREARLREILTSESSSSVDLQERIDALEADLPYNCEHVVPQSWFSKGQPMRGDLHHLFTCEERCNSFRGNHAFFDFADEQEALMEACGRREQNKFEPREGKGAAARATLYFLLRYPGKIDDPQETARERLRILLDWHRQEPVSLYERHRNLAIFEKQGNRNPLIDHPEWAERVALVLGLG